MDVNAQQKKQQIRWPTDWMHRHRMQSHGHCAFPEPTAAAKTLNSPSSSISSASAVSAAAVLPMKPVSARSVSAPKVSPSLSRRYNSPRRRIQQHRSPQPRRVCQPGPTPSPDLILAADRAERKRTLHDTTYRTYKSLPRSNRPFGLRDFALLREIFALAENLTNGDGAEVRLMDVLKAYDVVLQKHGMDSAEDTFYYRMLLKLSLRSEKDWWKKLNQEIVKNDILLKVTSFRNHKLLLCYWLQWRCHHEKGVQKERISKKSQYFNGESKKGCYSPSTQDGVDINAFSASERHKHEVDVQNSIKNPCMAPFCAGPEKAIDDTLVVMDVVEFPVTGELKRFNAYNMIDLASAAFQSWQRFVRQRKRKRCMRERSFRQWNSAVCFNENNLLRRVWKFWQCFSRTRMMQAQIWHHNLCQRKCFRLWNDHCKHIKGLCESAENFYAKQILLSKLSDWKSYTSSLKSLCQGLCKRRTLLAWKQTVASQRHALQIMNNRLMSMRRKFLLLWRSRLRIMKQHKDILSQCQMIHRIHVLSTFFKGWHRLCWNTTRCRRQAKICQYRRSQRHKVTIMHKWRELIQYKRSLEEVHQFVKSQRAHFLLKKTFNSWLIQCQYNLLLKSKGSELYYSRKRRVVYNMLKIWEIRARRQLKRFQTCMTNSAKFYAAKLCEKSMEGWVSWIFNQRYKVNCRISISQSIAATHCRRILLHWKDIAATKKHDVEKINNVKSHLNDAKKNKYWYTWCQQSVYKTAISKCQARRNHKLRVLILKALQVLVKESPNSNKTCGGISLNKSEDKSSLQISEANKHIDANSVSDERRCLQAASRMLLPNDNMDQDTGHTLVRFQQQSHVKYFLQLLRKYTCQQKLANVLRNSRMSSVLKFCLQKWKHSTFEALQEKPHISMVRGQITQFPMRYKIMMAVLEASPRLISMKNFKAWKEWSNIKAVKRMEKSKAWEHLAKVLQKKTFASFHIASIKANTMKKCIRHFEILCLEKALLAWRTFSQKHSNKKNLKVSADSHYKSKLGGLMLRNWRLYYYISQRKGFVEREAEQFWRKQTLCKVLRAWINMFSEYKEKLQNFTWLKIRMDFQCLHNVLSAWRCMSQQKISQRDHLEYMKNRGRMRILYQKFHMWIWYIHRKKCLRAAEEMHRRRRMKLSLNFWVRRITQLKHKKETEDTVRNHTFNKFCKTTFLVWRDVTVMARHARCNQTFTLERIRHSRLNSTFLKWKEVVKTLKFINVIVNHYITRHKQKLFRNWYEIIKQEEMLSESHMSVAHIRRKRITKVVFDEWMHKAYQRHDERERSHKSLMFGRHRAFARIFRRWKKWTHARQTKEAFSLLVCGKLQRLYMKWAFNAWLKKYEIYVRRRAAFNCLVRVSDQHLLARSFQGMIGVVEESWHLKRMAFKAFKLNTDAIKVENAASVLQQQTCRTLLQFWKDRAVYNIAMHQKEQRFKDYLLRKACQGWITCTQEKKKLQEIGKTVSMLHSLFFTRQYWLQWQFRIEDVRYQQQFLLFKTMRAWIKYAKWKAFWRCMEQDVTLTLLLSLQKRVLWAWQSLTREIAIRKEQHQQERLLQREAIVLANRTERRQKLEALSIVFKEWQSRFRLTFSVSAFVNRLDARKKGYIWASWLEVVAQSHKAKLLQYHRMKCVLHSVFSKWQKACQNEIEDFTKREDYAVAFSSKKCVHRAWTQWVSYVSSCKYRVKGLQGCLELIENGRSCNSLREVIHIWRDYTLDRSKRRECSWAAEAAYKRHKLTDYFTAWHHYTVSSKDSASSLRGTIQLYTHRGSNHLQSMVGTRYRFRQGFGHITSHTDEDFSFDRIAATPSIVIEEVNPTVENLHQDLKWTPEMFVENEDCLHDSSASYYGRNTNSRSTGNTRTILHCQPRLLENGPVWDPARSIQFVGQDDWQDGEIDLDDGM